MKAMDIKVIQATPGQRKPKPVDEAKLGFGKHFSDHFFTMPYHSDRGWHDPLIEPYRPLQLDPTAMCLHYAQEIFEGMKAYRGKDGGIFMFRPMENIRRMNVSAERLCMPQLDENLFMAAITKLVLLDQAWIPRGSGTSVYIRPTMIATEPALGVHPSKEYLFFIIMGPVGAYYPEGFAPTKIFVTEEFSRAVPGGTGHCKAGGNYAASLYASEIAKKMGYTQVLWLDAVERKYVEEVGTSNMFFLIGDELITAALTGTILPGVTRDSVIRLAESWGVTVVQRRISMDEIMAAIAVGTLKEAFASGTAAIVSPVGLLHYRGKEYPIGEGRTGPLTERLYQEILQIQYGMKDDPFGWRVRIGD
jgi:branched-chain amino acid aminotransferase